MKRLLSVFLSLCILSGTLLIGGSAFAAESKFNEQKKQYNSLNSSFNFNGDKFVYSAFFEKNYQLRTAGNISKPGKAIMKDNWVSNLNYVGKYIYYTDIVKCAIMRRKASGGAAKTIVKFKDTQSINFIVSGKRLIYLLSEYNSDTYELESSTLYTCSLTGKGKKKIGACIQASEGYVSSYYTYKNKLYYANNNKLYCYNFKTKKSKVINKKFKNCVINSMEGANIYYFKSVYNDNQVGETFTVYRYSVSTKKTKKLTSFSCEEPLYSMMTTDNKVYVNTGTGAGNAFAAVKNGRLDYESYRSRYALGGECLGYYKNFVVLPKVKNDKNGNILPAGFLKIVKTK